MRDEYTDSLQYSFVESSDDAFTLTFLCLGKSILNLSSLWYYNMTWVSKIYEVCSCPT